MAAGGPLVGGAPAETGHTVEARLNTEDAAAGVARAPGTVTVLVPPAGPMRDGERARSVESVDAVFPAPELCPYPIGAVERGLGRATRRPATESLN